jgi:hypothetical protein
MKNNQQNEMIRTAEVMFESIDMLDKSSLLQSPQVSLCMQYNKLRETAMRVIGESNPLLPPLIEFRETDSGKVPDINYLTLRMYAKILYTLL